ncbi:hypothetical protein AB0K09_00535 [Streptomyces sp. NPDC049577]|uniref:hypothetical protein n=1 Tax=Streptomyces sp. NPDC049577 TaxID=3155153 RepID=UPI00342A93B0
MQKRVVVYPPDERGWRKVRYDGRILGTAYKVSDIPVFLAKAGYEDAENVDLNDESLFDWRGGGPDSWAESPP